MATGEELTDLIKDFASDLGDALPDPAAWGMWLKLLMEELERQAAETGQPVERFDLSLELVRQDIEEIKPVDYQIGNIVELSHRSAF